MIVDSKIKVVQEDPSDFEIFLGVFTAEKKFQWFSVSKHKTLSEGYKAYKKYVVKQLQYTDEELKRIWDTGRLDVELKHNNKTLNWTAIYCREAEKLTEKEKADLEKGTEEQIGKIKGTPHKAGEPY